MIAKTTLIIPMIALILMGFNIVIYTIGLDKKLKISLVRFLMQITALYPGAISVFIGFYFILFNRTNEDFGWVFFISGMLLQTSILQLYLQLKKK